MELACKTQTECCVTVENSITKATKWLHFSERSLKPEGNSWKWWNSDGMRLDKLHNDWGWTGVWQGLGIWMTLYLTATAGDKTEAVRPSSVSVWVWGWDWDWALSALCIHPSLGRKSLEKAKQSRHQRGESWDRRIGIGGGSEAGCHKSPFQPNEWMQGREKIRNSRGREEASRAKCESLRTADRVTIRCVITVFGDGWKLCLRI